jgi:anti-sigma factor RsiW
MSCSETQLLLHPLLDGELDAGHARDIEAHIAACLVCATQLLQYRALHNAMSAADLGFTPPRSLRHRIEAALPSGRTARAPSRRSVLRGFAMGSMATAAAAATVMFAIVRSDQDQRMFSEVISAHLRSLQAQHLTDVETSDQHTVKPWFNGKLDVSPPVIDLTAQGFTLLGGRLDYVDGAGVAAIVYRRRRHIINLFVAPGAGAEDKGAKIETVQGFNIRRWTEQGLNFWAVSDINTEELEEFGQKFDAAIRPGNGS